MIPPRFPVTEADITRVVARFYAKARAHAVLGPVFARHVSDWPAHEAKVAGFWQGAILHAKSYDGNPLAVHKAAGNVRAGMFTPWLALFEETLREELPPETAAAWSALAHKIGRGLSLGLQEYSGIPNLR